VIVCGLPGAGKTTLALALEDELQAVRFSADEWMVDLGIDLFASEARDRIEGMQWRLSERLLTLGQCVIVEWGTWAKAERDHLRTRARGLGADVELHFLDAPLAVLWERVRSRGFEQRYGSRALTREDMETYAAMFEPPDDAEMTLYDVPLTLQAGAQPDEGVQLSPRGIRVPVPQAAPEGTG
jgi:predicted kinase